MTDPQRPQHPVGWPCGPEVKTNKRREQIECYTDHEGCRHSCPVHADAAYAGPFMVAADENFRKQVLAMLEDKRAAIGSVMDGFAGALLTDVMRFVRDLPTGQLDDAKRMAKENHK